jgi:hypothetical protein
MPRGVLLVLVSLGVFFVIHATDGGSLLGNVWWPPAAIRTRRPTT